MKLKLTTKKMKQLNRSNNLPLERTKDVAGGTATDACSDPSRYPQSCRVH
ncbi:hypothetical protein [Pseudoalteromonas piscicida]|nr:hypothetical protein [Pseudoalteromonas piscicida]